MLLVLTSTKTFIFPEDSITIFPKTSFYPPIEIIPHSRHFKKNLAKLCLNWELVHTRVIGFQKQSYFKALLQFVQ